MTLATIRTEARTLLRDTNGMIFSDAFLNSAINMGILSTELLSGCYEPTAVNITLTANVGEYINPFDKAWTADTGTTVEVRNATKIYSVYYVSNTSTLEGVKGLARINPLVVGQEMGTATGTPSFYYDFGGVIGVYPIPSSTSGYLVVKGCKIGAYTPTDTDNFDADILGTTTTRLPSEFHRSIVYYAVMSAYIKDGKHSQAGMYYSKWVNEVWAWRQMIVERPIDTLDKTRFPDRVVVNQPNQPAAE